ncbi:hypothetical protein PC123_g21399 [Phytophthora cactorum]|nr:hypothetical protein PC123_g21399 [Phytophthora cactorum]
MGPPGHINREDVRRAFPVLLQQNPARREQVVDYQPQAGMTRAEEAFEEPAFEPNADEEIFFLPPHRTETGEDTLIQERNKADDPVIEQRAQDEPAQARVPVIIPDDDPREDEAAEQPPRDENHHYPYPAQNLTDEDWAEAQRLQRLHRAQRRATDRTNCTVQVCLMISAQLFPPQHFGPFLAIWLSGRLDVFFLEDLKHLLH